MAWLISAISGSLNVIVLSLLYMALLRGPVAVASPAASVFVVLLLGLNVMAGESWTIWQIVATFIVFGGVFILFSVCFLTFGYRLFLLMDLIC